MRYSKQRDEVLKTVLNSHKHPTAKIVYEEVKKIIPNISLGTVYRNLSDLTLNGSIRRIPMKDGNDRFDKTLKSHNHIYCEVCGAVSDIDNIIFENDLGLIETKTGFKITDCNFIIKGICQNCIKEGNY